MTCRWAPRGWPSETRAWECSEQKCLGAGPEGHLVKGPEVGRVGHMGSGRGGGPWGGPGLSLMGSEPEEPVVQS